MACMPVAVILEPNRPELRQGSGPAVLPGGDRPPTLVPDAVPPAVGAYARGLFRHRLW
jgi:hypothetical protein